MAQLITPDPVGDTPKQIEDKVRALPANQGLNDYEMWQKVDIEIASAVSAGKYRAVQAYNTGNLGDKHGRK